MKALIKKNESKANQTIIKKSMSELSKRLSKQDFHITNIPLGPYIIISIFRDDIF